MDERLDSEAATGSASSCLVAAGVLLLLAEYTPMLILAAALSQSTRDPQGNMGAGPAIFMFFLGSAGAGVLAAIVMAILAKKSPAGSRARRIAIGGLLLAVAPIVAALAMFR